MSPPQNTDLMNFDAKTVTLCPDTNVIRPRENITGITSGIQWNYQKKFQWELIRNKVWWFCHCYPLK